MTDFAFLKLILRKLMRRKREVYGGRGLQALDPIM